MSKTMKMSISYLLMVVFSCCCLLFSGCGDSAANGEKSQGKGDFDINKIPKEVAFDQCPEYTPAIFRMGLIF